MAEIPDYPFVRAYHPFLKGGAAYNNPGVNIPVLDDFETRNYAYNNHVLKNSIQRDPPSVVDRYSSNSAPNPLHPFAYILYKDICHDGGLLKYIGQNGNYEDFESEIKDLDSVFVRYEVRLNDHFDDMEKTIVKISTALEVFTFKDGLFCPAIPIAVKTMMIGETAIFIVKPQYGFGDKGKPALLDEGPVPPGATLHIVLELVSWKKITHYKILLKEGEGNECPIEGDVVKLKLIGRLQDGTVFLNKGYGDGVDDQADLFEFKTDDEQVVDGLDQAVMTMKKGEIASLTIPPQCAFGSSESHQELAVVPPNSAVYYSVELVSFVKGKKIQDMNNEEKIEAACKKKKLGDALFCAGKYARAYERFMKAIDFVMKVGDPVSDEEMKIVRSLWDDCFVGFSKCKKELEGYDQDEEFLEMQKQMQMQELEATNDWNRHVVGQKEYGGMIYCNGEYEYLRIM